MKTQTLKQFHWNLFKFDLRYYVSTRFLGYPFELKTRINNYFTKKSAPENKIVIFSSGRSGSTLLVELLNSFPSVHCDPELLKRKLISPLKLIKAKSSQVETDIYGFKLLSYQLRDIQSSIPNKKAFLKKLSKNGYKIIYLHRENKLQQTLSTLLAMTQSKWHSTKANSTTDKIMIDIQKLDQILSGMEELTQFEEEMLDGFPLLKLIYEKDLLDRDAQQQTMQKLSEFLHQDYTAPKSRLKKLNNKHFSDYIYNWEEVKTYLEHSKFAHYIIEEVML